MKTTVASLDLSKSKKKAFSNKVDGIIKAIQKGKIDKAELKVDKFRSALVKKLSKLALKKPKPGRISREDAEMLLEMINGLLANLK